MKVYQIIAICVILLNYVDSARILGLYHHPGRSHHKLGETLFKELVKRGHEVVMVSSFPLKDPPINYTDIFVHEVLEDMNQRAAKGWFQMISSDAADFNTFEKIRAMGDLHTDMVFQNSEVQKLITTNEKFDLVIIDQFMSEAEFVFAHIFDCPFIISASAGTFFISDIMVGNFIPYAYVPDRIFIFSDKMTFYERFLNTIMRTLIDLVYDSYVSKQQEIIQKHFPEAPPLSELQNRLAAILVNGNYIFEHPRPSVPKLIDVAGYHVQETKPLTGDIKKFVDSASEGFVFFSLGSNVKTEFLEERRQRAILQVFSKLPVKVVWKLDQPLDNIPKNVFIASWLPQNDLLGHPNIKVFVTHGGLLSTIEAVHHGVPTVGIPMFGDQFFNVFKNVDSGSGLKIKASELNEVTLFNAISEVLSNSSYTKMAKFRSDLLRNQDIKPMDKAIFWVEHIIKHKGASHLEAASVKLPWYKLYLVDVTLAIAALVFLIAAITYYVVKCSLRKICRCFKKKQPVKDTKTEKKD